MNRHAERESYAQEGHSATIVTGNHGEGAASRVPHEREVYSGGPHSRGDRAAGREPEAPSLSGAMTDFIERNPLLATGAALAVGAAVVMAVYSRQSTGSRIDKRMTRAARSMDRAFSRELKALRQSDMADRLGHFGSTLGDAFSRVDLGPLAERGRLYLDAARRRMGA